MSKKFVEYPVAKSFKEAETHLRSGGELWQESLNKCPEHGYANCGCCYQIEDIATLRCDYPELDETDLVHLVPTTVPKSLN